MMPNYKYTTSSSDKTIFTDAITHIVSQYSGKRVVRMVFFAGAEHFSDTNREIIRTILQEQFKTKIPAWSFVAQMPLDSIIDCEICEICDDSFELEHRNYGVLVKGKNYKEIIAGGIMADCCTIEEQCSEVFAKFDTILKSENFKVESIVRQWNYIENITKIDGKGEQNYQIFNDARSLFYKKGDWSTIGYPAATGIGTSAGGIMIDFNAVVSEEISLHKIDNSLQVAAHDYSKQVLLGESPKLTTPKFERAKAVCDQNEVMVYISGTAAIRGEKSLKDQNAAQQIKATMENIDFLIGEANLKCSGIDCNNIKYSNLRVYIKCNTDYNAIKIFMQSNYAHVPAIYLLSDVCRDELLVEVEGMAFKNNN